MLAVKIVRRCQEDVLAWSRLGPSNEPSPTIRGPQDLLALNPIAKWTGWVGGCGACTFHCMIIVDQPNTARMGSCCSHDHNEAAATAVEEQAEQGRSCTPTSHIHCICQQRPKHAIEPAAKTGFSQTSAEAAAAADPLDNFVADGYSVQCCKAAGRRAAQLLEQERQLEF